MCKLMDNLKSIFSKPKVKDETPSAKVAVVGESSLELEEERWLSLKNFRSIVRIKDPSRGGPNMPKRQQCPECGSWSKRKNKTVGGANYHCRTHGDFFVRSRQI